MKRIDLHLELDCQDDTMLAVEADQKGIAVGILERTTDAAAFANLDNDGLRALRDHLTLILDTEQ